ncbi:hypothetical protein [Microvirga makkahensis]|uniref:TonB C-terminal domain-containing protein n=1 Tax=Microvirga makkahensis TaxID=1128670 RepID=A0A7X3SRI0_9HYPH|nr:hypothetical protein [Microvirga makkahensis]MXQ14676.1 hypothetical protein [Microvirga makkahensis]
MGRARPFGARTAIAALLLWAASADVVAAQEGGQFFGQRDWYEPYEPPPSLPEGIQGVVRPDANTARPQRINTIRDVFQALQACWLPPSGSGYSGQEITLRLSFKRNGEVLGKPRITYYKPGAEGDQRKPFTRSVREAFERCTPFPFTESFGAAIAGRIFAFRFVDARPM